MILRNFMKSTVHISTIAIIVGLLIPFLPASAQAQVPNDWGVAGEIPEQANRIILDQEGVPAADVYVDALYTLERQDFKITDSEDTFNIDELSDIIADGIPLVFMARKQITDDMAIEISANVMTIPGGGRLVASVKYADSVETDVPNWKQAKWTEGRAKEAFYRGLETIRGIRYDAMDFEMGVAVER